MEEKRQQISVALNLKEMELLDSLRCSIPRAVFMRALLIEKKPKINIKERVLALKKKYLTKSTNPNVDYPTRIKFSHLDEIELEKLDWGELSAQVMSQGIKQTITHFLGLKIEGWNEQRLLVGGQNDMIDEQ